MTLVQLTMGLALSAMTLIHAVMILEDIGIIDKSVLSQNATVHRSTRDRRGVLCHMCQAGTPDPKREAAMPGISDSNHPDDYKLHLEVIIAADDRRGVVAEGESEDQRIQRESVVLRASLRSEVERVLGELRSQVPGLSSTETEKLLTTRAGRDALAAGERTLARVDDHLQSVTQERNPVIARRYGVYGDNPRTFGGVLRSLELSATENARIAALPEGDAERELQFSPFIAREVERSRDALAAVLGARTSTRAELSRAVDVKDQLLLEAGKVVSSVRQHLYANLPDGKQDPDLREYGFRPIRTRSSGDDGGDGPAEPIAPVEPIEDVQ